MKRNIIYKGVEIPFYFIDDETGIITRETDREISEVKIKTNTESFKHIITFDPKTKEGNVLSLRKILLETYFGIKFSRDIIEKIDENKGYSKDNIKLVKRLSTKRRFSSEEVEDILYDYYVERIPMQELEDIYDTSYLLIINILCGNTYSEVFDKYRDKLAEVFREVRNDDRKK